MLLTEKTVLVDFNDSFTHNIIELLRKTGHRDYLVIPIASLVPEELVHAERVILSPGPGVPEEYPAVYEALKRLEERVVLKSCRAVPVLGICLGHQLISSYFGGGLVNMKSVVHGQPRIISLIAEDPVFRGVPKSFRAGLYHSWAVSSPLPEQLELIAESEDGVVMAVRHKMLPVRGIQFHPESCISEYGCEIINNFFQSGCS
jgi:anthranilate synthase/aminodeoxychorismate synthase-like glutamine amidotransferase